MDGYHATAVLRLIGASNVLCERVRTESLCDCQPRQSLSVLHFYLNRLNRIIIHLECKIRDFLVSSNERYPVIFFFFTSAFRMVEWPQQIFIILGWKTLSTQTRIFCKYIFPTFFCSSCFFSCSLLVKFTYIVLHINTYILIWQAIYMYISREIFN